MNKSITLLACSLLLASNYALAEADRPAMSDRSEMYELEPIVEEIPEPAPEMATESVSEVSAQPPEVEMTDTQVTGDVIEIQEGETLPVRVLDFPRRGMTMDKVRNELGEPLEISATIGKPPITVWTYGDRVVYFEYSSVVHVVATR